MPSSGAAADASYPSSEASHDGYAQLPLEFARDRPQLAGDGPRTLARLAAWPLVSGQFASGGSMSRVAGGHFRRKREALDIEGKHVTIQGNPGSQLYHRLSTFYPSYPSHRSTSLTLALTMFNEPPRRKGPVYDQLTGTPPTGAVKCSCIPRDSRMALTRSTCALPPGAAASRISSRVSGSSVGFLAPAAFLST